MSMTYCLFAGCSYVAGTGFELDRHDPRLWTKILHSDPRFNRTNYLNVGRPGIGNARIFYETVKHLVTYSCEFAFVAWTSIPRYEMDLGLETYDCSQVFMPNTAMRDHNINGIKISQKYLEKVRDRFTSLVHDHREIFYLLGYINALIKIAHQCNTKIFFINSLCPWDRNFFIKQTPDLPSELTPYTQKLLNVDTRDDIEIFQLYDIMHQEYQDQGNIQSHYWLNLYQSIRSLRIDVNSDGIHPGEKTNRIVVDLLLKQIEHQI